MPSFFGSNLSNTGPILPQGNWVPNEEGKFDWGDLTRPASELTERERRARSPVGLVKGAIETKQEADRAVTQAVASGAASAGEAAWNAAGQQGQTLEDIGADVTQGISDFSGDVAQESAQQLGDMSGWNAYKQSEDYATIRENWENTDQLGKLDQGFRLTSDFVLDNPNFSAQEAGRSGYRFMTGTTDEEMAEDVQRAWEQSTSPFRGIEEEARDVPVAGGVLGFGTETASAALQSPFRTATIMGTGIDPTASDASTERTAGAVDVADLGITVGTAGAGRAATSLFRTGAREVSERGARGAASNFAARFSEDAGSFVNRFSPSGSGGTTTTTNAGSSGFRNLFSRSSADETAETASSSGGGFRNLFTSGADDATRTGVDPLSDAATRNTANGGGSFFSRFTRSSGDEAAESGSSFFSRAGASSSADAGEAGASWWTGRRAAGVAGATATAGAGSMFLLGSDGATTTTTTNDGGGGGGGGGGGSDGSGPGPDPDGTRWQRPENIEELAGGWVLQVMRSQDGQQTRYYVVRGGQGETVEALTSSGRAEQYPMDATSLPHFQTEEAARDAHALWLEQNPTEAGDGGGGGNESKWSEWQEVTTAGPWHVNERTDGETYQYMADSQNDAGEDVYLDTNGTVSYSLVTYDSTEAINSALQRYFQREENGQVSDEDRPTGASGSKQGARESSQSSIQNAVQELMNNKVALGAIAVVGLAVYAQRNGGELSV